MTPSPAAILPLQVVALMLDEVEARAIYPLLVAHSAPSHILDFDDAWARFGGRGPLLEFTHFVCRHETLRVRLSNQVRRLRDDVRTGNGSARDLELLRRVSVATACGASVDARRLVSELALPDAARTLDIFEREYHQAAESADGNNIAISSPYPPSDTMKRASWAVRS